MRRTNDNTRYSPLLAFALLIPLVLSGCVSYTGTRRAYMERMKEYVPPPARPVILIPGFGNSRIYDPVDDKLVWGLGKNLVHTKYSDDLDLPVDPSTQEFVADRLVPDGSFAGSRAPFNIAYSLGQALQSFGGYESATDNPDSEGVVHAFAYDWRLSATTNARRLDEFIDSIRSRWQADPPKVDVIAHSAGGLVLLTYLKLGGLGPEAAPEEIEAASGVAASKVANIILLGVPQHGTNEAVRALARGEKLIRRELSPEMMASFPSLPELLPSEGKVFIDEKGERVPYDVWEPSTWQDLGMAVWASTPDADPGHVAAFESSLRRAHRLRQMLERPLPPGVRETVIAGDCVPTAERILLRSDHSLAFYASELSEDEARLGRVMFVPGDGSIEAKSALGESSRDHVVCAGHHGMANDPNVHRTLIRVLLQDAREPESTVRSATRQVGTSSMESQNPR